MASWMDTVDAFRLRGLHLQGARSRMIPSSLGTLHALEWMGEGSGPPVVLIHGLGSCAADYGPLMRILRKRHQRVLAPDLPGHGHSACPQVPLTSERLTIALLELMDRVTDGPAVVLGNSLGGIAALRYALLRPNDVLALILVSPGGAPMNWGELDAFKKGFDLQTPADAMRFVRRFLGPPQSGMGFLALGVQQRMARPGPRSLLAEVTPEVLLRPEEVRALAPPTLVLWGEKDDVLPHRDRAFFAENLPPHGRFESLKGMGHSPYLDDLNGFYQRVEVFLERLSLRSTRRTGGGDGSLKALQLDASANGAAQT